MLLFVLWLLRLCASVVLSHGATVSGASTFGDNKHITLVYVRNSPKKLLIQ